MDEKESPPIWKWWIFSCKSSQGEDWFEELGFRDANGWIRTTVVLELLDLSNTMKLINYFVLQWPNWFLDNFLLFLFHGEFILFLGNIRSRRWIPSVLSRQGTFPLHTSLSSTLSFHSFYFLLKQDQLEWNEVCRKYAFQLYFLHKNILNSQVKIQASKPKWGPNFQLKIQPLHDLHTSLIWKKNEKMTIYTPHLYMRGLNECNQMSPCITITHVVHLHT